MSLLVPLLISWIAVHLYVAACYAFVFYRQRQSGEYLAFSVLVVAFSLYTSGAVMILRAPDPLGAAQGAQLQLLSAGLAVPSFIEFCSRVLKQRTTNWTRAAYAFAAVAALVALSGLGVDPNRPLADTAYLPFTPRTHEATIAPAGLLVFAAVPAFLVGFILHARKLTVMQPESRLLLTGALLCFPPFILDLLFRVVGVHALYLSDHVILLMTAVTSLLLMWRFVDVGDQLEQRTTQLRRSYDDLRHVQEEIVRKEQLAAVGELSAVIAHEVRNPLAILKNAVAGLRRNALAPEDRATLFTILDEETDRLNRLVRDLLSYARPVTLQTMPLPTSELVEHAIDLALRGPSRISNVEVRSELEGVPETIQGDKDLLERAFINIVENALQAMPNGGRLHVTYSTMDIGDDQLVTFSFRDTGEGMDTLVRSRATDPFFTTRSSGTGLGLAIVERVIRAHAGTVELAKNDDAGSTVRVSLPVRRRPSHNPEEEQA